ncbi:aryl-sulfate sulfotransferase [Winogradskyella thalassocola]|uniref:Por secretion system C-terminal sorting domain-containing protein n=1 Tax=Winogradskyella thalassocola TaxID=262004 RepID=A0A1G8INC7_9FLAO|nr:aryl-sulfate sulfotransferase [Winogradskyella thalassocola]SDI20446.1 Por secretion system C-terminal sorting domain-containing protein [Winogradskyella thalassocola]
MKKILFLIVIISFNLIKAQETVGLIFNDDTEIKSNGYTLFNPSSDNRVFLINNCGEVVNQWEFDSLDSRNGYLLENGNLLVGSELTTEIKDWDDNLIWSINYQDFLGTSIHHDIEPLPNGNYLVLVRDVYSKVDLLEEGLDPSYNLDTMVLDKILEIEPVGTNSANIVWEWKLFDHLVQDYDSSKSNYGVISSKPHLWNLNYDGGQGSNPIHVNAIDYNAELDQIAISSRHLSEVFIIDHSTTTYQASTNSGGLYNKGGGFLWRWGNPQVYNQGTASDQKLGRQHDIKWITEGPNQGKLSVFSNDGYGSNLSASSVHIIDPNATDGVYSLSSGKFLPQSYFWSWDGTIMNEVMHGGAQCGVQIMSNGNALINESDIGRLSEIDSSGNVIWVYMIPVSNNSDFNQFESPIGNGSFRAHRYSGDYSGFDNVVFNNTGIIEDVNLISEECIDSGELSVDDSYLVGLNVYPNPTKDLLNFNLLINEIEVYDLSGKTVLSKTDSEFINLENLADGLYLIKISANENSRIIKITKN